MKATLHAGLKIVLGILLLQYSSSALAFTLITLPQEGLTPGSTITDTITLNAQVQPVLGAISAHLFDTRRKSRSSTSANSGNLLASNSHMQTTRDYEYMKVSSHGGAGGGLQSVWINSTFSDFENDFSRTEFKGDMHMLLAGFDYTLSDKYIFGIAIGYETTNINTRFNIGNEDISGYNISPYFAFLLTDSWSLDLSLGHGSFDTDQYRTRAILVGPLPALEVVESDFSSTRDFVALNLTHVSTRGKWYLTGSAGLLYVKKKQDNYDESSGGSVDGLSLDIEQFNIGGEAAYGHRDSESYVGLIYEKNTDIDEIEFTTGDQPPNDDDSMLLSLGWRYYGRELTANFEFSSRLGQDDASDNIISSTLRIDL